MVPIAPPLAVMSAALAVTATESPAASLDSVTGTVRMFPIPVAATPSMLPWMSAPAVSFEATPPPSMVAVKAWLLPA